MLSCPPRCPLPCRISDAVYEKIIGSTEVSWTKSKLESIKADCDYLQEFRCKIELDKGDSDIQVLLEYLSCLQSVLLKLDLENFSFIWTNSIGYSRAPVQGPGLRFECLNLLFNIASHYMRQGARLADDKDWQGAKESFQMASGVILRARESELHQLRHGPPVELQNSTLAFLFCLNLTQAAECQCMIAMDANLAWNTHKYYVRLVTGPTVNKFLKEWLPALQHKANHFGSIACLEAHKPFQGSRKKFELALEYSVLLKSLEFAVEDDVRLEAQRLINEPRGRRPNTSLSQTAESVEFQESNYFSLDHMVQPIPFTVSKSPHAMLANLLPLTIASAPLILSEKLKNYVEKEICCQLYNINRYIRSVMVKCNFPCSIELLRSSGAAPISLVRIGTRIKKAGGIKRLRDLLELGDQEAQHCTAVINSAHSKDKEELEALRDCVTAGLNALKVVESKLDRSAHLIEILERGEPYISQFLGKTEGSVLNQPGSNRPSSTALFNRSDAFFAALGQQIYERTQKCIHLEERAREYNFFNPVMSLINSYPEPKEWSLKDLKGCFDAALAEFKQDKKLLESDKIKAEETVQELLRIENESRRLRRGLADVDKYKLKVTQSLMFAALEYYDISYNLNESSRYYSTLNTAVVNFKNRSNQPTIGILGDENRSARDPQNGPVQYTWQPGMTINFV